MSRPSGRTRTPCTQLQNDALYKRKLEYIRAHDLVIYHFHDHWHAKRPVDGINYGMAQTDRLGAVTCDALNNRAFNIPAHNAAAIWRNFFSRSLGDRTLRVVGRPRSGGGQGDRRAGAIAAVSRASICWTAMPMCW